MGILGDHDEHEGAQVTFRTQSTGEYIAVSLFKTNATEPFNQLSGSLPLVDRLTRLIGQSLSTHNYDERGSKPLRTRHSAQSMRHPRPSF